MSLYSLNHLFIWLMPASACCSSRTYIQSHYHSIFIPLVYIGKHQTAAIFHLSQSTAWSLLLSPRRLIQAVGIEDLQFMISENMAYSWQLCPRVGQNTFIVGKIQILKFPLYSLIPVSSHLLNKWHRKLQRSFYHCYGA